MKNQPEIKVGKYYHIRYDAEDDDEDLQEFYEYIQSIDKNRGIFNSHMIKLDEYRYYSIHGSNNEGELSRIKYAGEISKKEWDKAMLLCVI